MLSTDTEARRLLVREHQEALWRDAMRVSVKDEAPVERADPRHPIGLPRLWIRFLPARGLR